MAWKFDKNNINIYNPTDNDIFNIIENMNIDEIKIHSLQKKIPLHICDNQGNNLIHKILLNQDKTKTEITKLNIIKYLVNENVNPDQPNKDNSTPLHLASEQQLEKIVDYLLSLKCNSNFQDNNGNTAIHHLLAGKISVYKSKKQKPLIPLSKKDDDDKKDLLIKFRKKIWEEIKKKPFIQSLNNTFEKSIGKSNEVRNILIDIQDKLTKKDYSVKKEDELKIIQEVVGNNLINFEKEIEKKWGSFDTNENIVIHEKTDDSDSYVPKKFQLIDNLQNIGIIKYSNMVENLKKEIQNHIKDNIYPLLEMAESKDNQYENKYITELITSGFTDNVPAVGIYNNFDIPDENDYKEYNDKIRAKNAIDNADNIIDLDQNTFIGGSREIIIGNEFIKHSDLDVTDLDHNNNDPNFKLQDQLLLGLINTDNNIDNILDEIFQNLQFNTSSNNQIEFNNPFVKDFLKKYITNEKIDDIDFIQFSNYFQNYETVRNLIHLRESYNKGQWLYIFLTAVYCLQDDSNLLVGDFPQKLLFLCSALIYVKNDDNNDLYKQNLQLSLIYSMKSAYIDNIICKVDPGDRIQNFADIFKEWILFLFNFKLDINNLDDIANYENKDNIDNIVTAVKKLLENKNIPNNLRNLFEDHDVFDKLPDCEKVCFSIMKYYNNLEEKKPLLQNVVDTISILRYYYLHKNYNYVNEVCLQKLRRLYAFTNYDIYLRKIRKKSFDRIINIDDDSNLIYHLTYNIIPSDVYYRIDEKENENTVQQTKQYFNLKYIEAKHLGLQYVGCLPKIEQDVYNTENKLHLLNFYYNSVYSEANNKNYKYFNLNLRRNFRPPTNDNMCATLIEKLNIFNRLQNKVLSGTANITLKQIFKDIAEQEHHGEYGKLVPNYYPILQALSEHYNFVNRLNDCNNEDINKLSNFTYQLNKLNADIFLYYYIKTINDNTIEIPKFFYYQIPTLENQGEFLIFNNNNTSRVLPKDDYDGTDSRDTTDVTITNNSSNYGYFNNKSNYNLISDNIINGYFIPELKIVNNNFKTSKSKELPPSFMSNLKKFYEYNVINIIKEVLDKDENITNFYNDDFNKLITNPDNLISENDLLPQKYLLVAQIIQDLIGIFIKQRINIISDNLFRKILEGNGYRDGRFIKEIELIDINNILKEEKSFDEKLDNDIESINKLIHTDNKVAISLYKFSEPYKEEDLFLNYSNNYGSVNLYSSLYKIKINDNILKKLSEHCNIFVKNLENKNCLYPILNNLNYKKLKKLKNHNNLDFRNTELNIKNDSVINYILQKYKNHIERFISKEDKIEEQIEHFVSNQYQEIEELIYANDEFNNNILRNLKLSFSICAYITIQYIKEKDTKSRKLEFNNKNNDRLPKKDIYLILSEIKNKEIDDYNFPKYGLQVTKGKIINRYNSIIKHINNQRTIYMYGWKKFLKNLDVNNNDELDVVKDLISEYSDAGDLTRLKNNINSSKSKYIYNEKHVEEYFTKERYTDDNEPLRFVKNLLIHLTENVICNGLEIIIKKILYQELKTQSTSSLIRIGEKIDVRTYHVMEKLYQESNSIAEKMVINAVKIFKNRQDELNHTDETAEEILSSLVDYLKLQSSAFKLSDFTITILKDTITKYFDTISYKIINNWNVVIENIFMFMINQSRYIQTLEILLS